LLVAAGFFTGPVFPLLIAIGGDLFPHHLGRMTGGMTVAATIGALSYPPLIGFIAEAASLRTGLVIAGLLGIPAIVALVFAIRTGQSSGSSIPLPTA
jgi:MFS family permease